MYSATKQIIHTHEAILATKRSKVRFVFKIFCLIIIALAFVATIHFLKGYPNETRWAIRLSLVLAALAVIVFRGKKVITPSLIELQFFPDYLILHRPHRRYNSWVVRNEYSKMKYSDITQCVYLTKSNIVRIYGKIYVVHYDVMSSGISAPTPLYAGFIENRVFEFSLYSQSGTRFRQAIEECLPVKMVVRNR